MDPNVDLVNSRLLRNKVDTFSDGASTPEIRLPAFISPHITSTVL